MSLTPKSHDSFQKLQEIVQQNPKQNLKTLCELEIIQIINYYHQIEYIKKHEIENLVEILLQTYEYKKPTYELGKKLLKDQKLLILSIYKSNIIVFEIKIVKLIKFLCVGSFDYKFETQIYYLELFIDSAIHRDDLDEVLEKPTLKNIEKFNDTEF
jgi:hypothetical protein